MKLNNLRRLILLFVAALAATSLFLSLQTGCIPLAGCTDDLRSGITIEVSDAETGAPLQATIMVTDGEYTETLEGFEPMAGRYMGLWERPGIYDIHVTSPGYNDVIIEDVEIDSDQCHVIREHLDISMQPAVSAARLSR